MSQFTPIRFLFNNIQYLTNSIHLFCKKKYNPSGQLIVKSAHSDNQFPNYKYYFRPPTFKAFPPQNTLTICFLRRRWIVSPRKLIGNLPQGEIEGL